MSCKNSLLVLKKNRHWYNTWYNKNRSGNLPHSDSENKTVHQYSKTWTAPNTCWSPPNLAPHLNAPSQQPDNLTDCTEPEPGSVSLGSPWTSFWSQSTWNTNNFLGVPRRKRRELQSVSLLLGRIKGGSTFQNAEERGKWGHCWGKVGALGLETVRHLIPTV